MTLYESNNWGSYTSLDNYDWYYPMFERDFGLLGNEAWDCLYNPEDFKTRSIYSDCQLIESSGSVESSDVSETSEISETVKYEIRNRDCMWSGAPENSNGSSISGKSVRNNSISSSSETSAANMHIVSPNRNATFTYSVNRQNSIKLTATATAQNIQNIPPGTSLLINSRNNQQRKVANICKVIKSNILTTAYSKEREIVTQVRPDTPLSLNNDPPEFKHNVDLSACVMGSNNISLDSEAAKTIKKLKEELENDNNKSLDIGKIMPGKKDRSLSEVLNAIGSVEKENSFCVDNESDSDECSSITYSNSPPVAHSDHSYTRSKSVDVTGYVFETPSDSDGEIDVVSVCDKKLPTNPSDKDRRALQTKVAHKISARIVRNANGIRTIPPRRRRSIDNCTPANTAMTVCSNKTSVPNSRYISPAVTPCNSYSSPASLKCVSNIRKRSNASLKDDCIPPNKKHRGKKQRSPAKRHYYLDEADNIEKRNLHNDMERQRRIGLKNLFEALKKQVPSIKDKDRVPKVNILREAAKLCEQITQDDKLLMVQKHQLEIQLQRKEAQLKALKLSKITPKMKRMK